MPPAFRSRGGRIAVLGHCKVDGAQQVLELRTREGHGLRGAVVERAIRANDEHARFAEQRGFLNANRGQAAGGADVQAPLTCGLQVEVVAHTQVFRLDLVGHGLGTLRVVTADSDYLYTAFFKLGHQAFEFHQVFGADGAMQATVKDDQVKRGCRCGAQHVASTPD